MALHPKYGKDRPGKGSEGFISGALTGGSGKSNGIFSETIDRKGQSIMTPEAMDNVTLAMDIESSITGSDRDLHGGTRNLKHSIDGAEAPADGDVGAAGPVDHIIIPNH